MFDTVPVVSLAVNNDPARIYSGNGVIALEPGDELTHTFTTSTFQLGLARLGDELSDE